MFAKITLLDECSNVARETGPAECIRAAEPEPLGFKNARRDQTSVTSGLERKVLVWFARRTPACVNSDHLTLLGFVSMFLVGAAYALARSNTLGLTLATFFLVLNWLGDSLDGTVARVRNRQRPCYGFYVDHMVDVFGAFFLIGGLALSGYIDWRIAAGMLIAFLMLSIEVYLATYTLGVFRLSYFKFGPTEIRILLALGNVVLWLKPNARVFYFDYRLFDFGGCIAIAGMAIMLIAATAHHTSKLYREERLP